MSVPVLPPVRAGLIGFGFAGRTFHAPLLLSTPGLVLAAVVSRQPQAVHDALGPEVVVHADALDLLARDDIDLVIIATPNDSHHRLARAALEAGKAVVVDKPFTLDAREAEDLIALAAQRGLLLSVFHNRRWDGDFLTVQALVASGRLGRLVHMASHFDRFRPQVRTRWREAGGPAGGLWIDLGPHLLDQALQLFGWPQGLSVDIAAVRDGAKADDWFDARLRYAGGLVVTLHASALAACAGPRFELHGTRGGYRKWGLDAQEDALRAGQRPDPARPEAWGADPHAGELRVLPAEDATQADEPAVQAWPTLDGRYPHYYSAICAALRGRGPNPVPATEALAVMRLLDLGRVSAMDRRELPCPLPPAGA